MSRSKEVFAAVERALVLAGKGKTTVVNDLPGGGTLIYLPVDADPFDLIEVSAQIILKRQE